MTRPYYFKTIDSVLEKVHPELQKERHTNDRRAYHKQYYRDHKAHLAKIKADRQKHDLDYRLRSILRTIVQRCENPRHTSYRWYGGKNIKNFLTLDDLKILWHRDGAANMTKPSIDRESATDNYEFSKCCFRELADNQKRGWANKAARAQAIQDGMKQAIEVRDRNRRIVRPDRQAERSAS